jgi:hypothetical protein
MLDGVELLFSSQPLPNSSDRPSSVPVQELNSTPKHDSVVPALPGHAASSRQPPWPPQAPDHAHATRTELVLDAVLASEQIADSNRRAHRP